MLKFVEQLASQIRVADVLDAGVVGILAYCGLVWLRQRASKSVAVGLVLIAMLFLAARWLDMYLTQQLFRVGGTAVLLGLIVIFQQDIRRAFERLAASGLFQRGDNSGSTSDTIDILAELAAELAENRIGALLVFEGREPIERHVRGGVPVGGSVSLPLLLSIFHPQSPGHDGAVIIDADRVSTLGVHLPLSTNLAKLNGAGTRHAAALGLAERCDATIVVVSEERGTISLAEHGELRVVEPAEVKTELERRLRERQEGHHARNRRRLWSHNLVLKSLAVLLAIALWVAFAYRVEMIERTFVVPIEFRNAENWVVEAPRPTYAELTLSGSERDFDTLDASELAVSFDLQHVQEPNTYSFRTEDSLKNVPNEMQVRGVRPVRVRITVTPKSAEATASADG